MNLDIDEGIRIESNMNTECIMYINKRTSGYFVLEIEDKNSTNINEFRFYRDIRPIQRLIDRILENNILLPFIEYNICYFSICFDVM